MKKKIIFVIALLLFFLLLAGVGLKTGVLHSHYPYLSFLEDHDDHDGHDHDHDGHDHGKEEKKKSAEVAEDDDHEDEDALIHLTDGQRKLIAVTVSKAAAGTLEHVLRLPGELRLNLDETAKIMPHMPGFITEVPVREGDKVAAGQVLARMTSHKLGEYYSTYFSAVEMEKLALAEFEREKSLKVGNATTEKELIRTQREYADAEIARRRAEALLKSLLLDPTHNDHTHDADVVGNEICTLYEIRSPLNGTVIGKDITVGENFSEDNERIVFTVSNLERLWMDLQAGGNELDRLKTGMEVSVEGTDGRVRGSGSIVFLSPLISEGTRTGTVRVLVENRDGTLRPGGFGVGVIRIEPGADRAVLIPRDAVQLIDGETVVFVPKGDGFAPQAVKTGRSGKGFIEVLSGLAAGENYVSAGAFELKSILLTSGMDPHAGHGH